MIPITVNSRTYHLDPGDQLVINTDVDSRGLFAVGVPPAIIKGGQAAFNKWYLALGEYIGAIQGDHYAVQAILDERYKANLPPLPAPQIPRDITEDSDGREISTMSLRGLIESLLEEYYVVDANSILDYYGNDGVPLAELASKCRAYAARASELLGGAVKAPEEE